VRQPDYGGVTNQPGQCQHGPAGTYGLGLVSRVHIKGERREFYTTEKDVWMMFRIIARERKKREVDPTIEVLRESVNRLNQMPDAEGKYEREQIKNLLDFLKPA